LKTPKNKPRTDIKTVQLEIQSLGAKGDGIAIYNGEKTFVDGALPHEIIDCAVDMGSQNPRRGTIKNINAPSPHRVEPPCPHYAQCGGCTMQHIDETAYQSWKFDTVKSILAQKDALPNQWDDPIFIPPQTRRRATFKGIKNGKSLTLGYSQKQTHQIFNLKQCDVLHVDIVDLKTILANRLNDIIPHKGKITLSMQKMDNGIDVVLIGSIGTKDEPDLRSLETIAELVQSTNIIRFSWAQSDKSPLQILISEQSPIMQFGKLNVEIAPLAFLQPSSLGQNSLVQTVMNYCPDTARHAADLFCGFGTFTGALLDKIATVDAFEGESAAIQSLKNAGHHGALTRDLFRNPLMADELAKYDAVIIDPPRAGARTQFENLAKSNVNHIISISCNPATFARDAVTLLDNGYIFARATMIDQFIWTAHTEIIGLFVKA